jgi:hypothetical protein
MQHYITSVGDGARKVLSFGKLKILQNIESKICICRVEGNFSVEGHSTKILPWTPLSTDTLSLQKSI